MAVHTGDVLRRPDGTFAGPTMNRCGRLVSAGHGGQVLISSATWALVSEDLSAR